MGKDQFKVMIKVENGKHIFIIPDNTPAIMVLRRCAEYKVVLIEV